MKTKQLPVALLPRERSWGIRYLLFQLVFLGPLLSWLLILLGRGSDGVLLDFVYFAVNLGAVVWIFRSYLWQSLKHGLSHWPKLLISLALGLAVHYILTQGLNILIERVEPGFYNPNDEAITKDSQSNFLLTALGAVVLVPLAEETLYRGLVFGALHSKSRLLAYALSTLFFSFIHVMGYIGIDSPSLLVLSFLGYIPAGLLLACAYEYSGSILAPALLHTAINAIAIYSMR